MSYLKQVFAEFFRDQCPTLAAALSYYTVFALPPLLFLLLTVVTGGLSVVYDSQTAEEKAEGILERQAAQLLGNPDASDEIAAMIERSQHTTGKWWKTLLSLTGVVVAITGLMGALQISLNRVWGVRPDPDRSPVRMMLRKRAVSFALILGLGFLLVVSMAVSGVMVFIGDQLEAVVGVDPLPAAAINYGVQSLVAFVVFATIFKVLPDARVNWRDVVVGAGLTTALFLLGRLAIQQYFVFAAPGARFGAAAASLAVILVWVYYSAMILLLGAEATQVYAHRRGRSLRPRRRAVRVVESLERGE
ncbi:hypothetical protein Mal64_20880 [Pseudobythopirellula maris]|uniref:Uncharacterized protein n=1 Tax=Pseudobythopirellula maris TaxID=2527991 RepID=A0A5C5ZQN5_9BACT|nr:YihY/virulence factor BrkB family protein [Pseudobythopirellula maris]TWT88603.1 hypothetical protein Mal64_20880 [Pseudobythopirellula maris]